MADAGNPVAVVMRAEALSRKTGPIGAVAFNRTGDPTTGDFGDANQEIREVSMSCLTDSTG
jgi:hypothetical protein